MTKDEAILQWANALEPEHPDALSSVPAEKAILGAILLDNSLFEAAYMLMPDDFYLAAHQLLFLRIGELIAAGEPADYVTIPEYLRSKKEFDGLCVAPVSYITSLADDTIRCHSSVREWAKIVRSKKLLRQMVLACTGAIGKAYDGHSGFEIIEALMDSLLDISVTACRGLRP